MQEATLKAQIYDLEHQLQMNWDRLAADPRVSSGNKDCIRQFVLDRLAMGVTRTRAIIIIAYLRRLARLTSANFAGFDEKDIRSLMAELETKNYAQHTKNTSKVIFKTLMRSLAKPEAWFKWATTKTPQNRIRAETLLTEQEMQTMIETAENSQWKAAMALLFECGLRPGELLGLRIKDVVFNEHKAKLYCNGKTGQRTVYAYKSFNLLMQWAGSHPLRQNPDSPLWLNRHKKTLTLSNFNNGYKRISRKAGIPEEKRNMPYLARHTRVTAIYRDFGAVLGSKMAGHIPGSKQIKTYLHLSESDVENALDAANGLKPAETIQKPQQCHACGLTNRYDDLICQKCAEPLSTAGAVVVEHEKQAELEELRQIKKLVTPQLLKLLKDLEKNEVQEAVTQAIKQTAQKGLNG